MSNSDSVAQDQIKAFVDRIMRLREEERSIKGDIKEVYAEAKGNGFDKTVLGKIVLHVERLADPKAANTMQEQDALFDLYLEAYFGKRSSHTHAHAREDEPEHDADGVIIEPQATLPAQTAPAELPVPVLAAEREAVESSATEPDATPAGAVVANGSGVTGGESATDRDLATGHTPTWPLNPADDGQIAPHSEPAVSTLPSPDTAEAAGRHSVSSSRAVPAEPHRPGDVWTERTPHEPVRWHDYARCFPEHWGMALAELKDDIREHGVTHPIVKSGNDILDGRARYTIARELLIDYPVTEYAGTDPLLDVIRWNLEARKLGANERKLVATKLAKLCPDRGEEIATAFGLDHGRAAAE